MKHFLKGAAAVIIVLIANIIIHVFCNLQGIQLDSIITTTVSTICAIWIYRRLDG